MNTNLKDMLTLTIITKVLLIITIVSSGIFLNSVKNSEINRYMFNKTHGTYIIYKLDNTIKSEVYDVLNFLK